ncbi:hypothetical protein ACWKYK_26575, partial [Enterobacter hormaechei]
FAGYIWPQRFIVFQGLFPDNNLRDVPLIKLKGSGYLRGELLCSGCESGQKQDRQNYFFHVSHACKLHMLSLLAGIAIKENSAHLFWLY